MFYLLVPALVLVSAGVAASHSANTTEPPDEGLKNQTLMFHTNENGPTEPNMTTELQDELQNNRSAALSEEDEGFQDQETWFPHKPCSRNLLVEFSHSYCGEIFQADMKKINPGDWCVMKNIIRPYNDLTVCLEKLAYLVDCYFPNPDIQDFFLHIHSSYFHNCTEEEEELPEDAPTSLVVALTIIPVSFIPVLVYLMFWRH